MAAIGEVIDDKYEILKLIGRGGMSRVYLAMDKRLNKQWAVKEIEKRARDKNNEVVIQSAIAEANMIKKLDHPALPRIVDIIDNGKVIYVIMDYIEGEALSKILETEGAQPEDAVIEWAKQLCEVLDYLHTRIPPIIYRDMKPANIMLKPDGTVKLIDFGIAREYKEHNLSDTVNMGTKGYAAPEQFGNAGQTDARTDVYCLGVTLYHLVTGHNPAEPPYEIYPIRHWDPQLSAGLEAIIQRCVQQNPDDRYQSCAELMYALQHYEEYGEEYRNEQRKKLRSFVVTLVCCVVCLCLAFVSLGVRKSLNNSGYDQNMENARTVTDYDEKIDYYKKAIEIKPLEIEAYLELVGEIEKHDSFTLEDEKIIENVMPAKIKSELRNDPQYADLCYKIGALYWFDFKQDDENGKEGRIHSVYWFNEVITYSKENSSQQRYAEIYKNIGEFDSNITVKATRGEDSGEYKTYWSNVDNLVSMISENKENELTQLEVCEFVMNTIDLYAKNFNRDGVPQEDLENVFDKVLKILKEIPDKALDSKKEEKDELLQKADDIKHRIQLAYTEVESSESDSDNKKE